jgi:hypothetical protein
MILLAPFALALWLIFEGLLISTIITLYIDFYVIVFLLTVAFTLIRAVSKSDWPRDPRKTSIRHRRKPGFDALGRPRQATWSDRR